MNWIPIVASICLLIGLVLMVIAAVMIARGRKGAKAGAAAPRPKGAPQRAVPQPPMASRQPQAAMPPPPPPAPAPFSPPPPPGMAQDAPAEPTVQMDLSGMGAGAAGKTVVVAPVPRFFGKLVGIRGPLEGREFTVDEEGFIIGRDQQQAQLVITDPRVSKKHVWVGVRNGEVWASDKGSTNGTYINKLGSRIGEEMLNDGDTLIISEDVARFQYRKG